MFIDDKKIRQAVNIKETTKDKIVLNVDITNAIKNNPTTIPVSLYLYATSDKNADTKPVVIQMGGAILP